MSRHSKNNTGSSIFTYGERQMLKDLNEWGEIETRLGVDSQKKFEQCPLCLNILTNPVSCQKGHLFCKECLLKDLLFQKKKSKEDNANEEAQNKKEVNEKGNLIKEMLQMSEPNDKVVNKFDKLPEKIEESKPEIKETKNKVVNKGNENIVNETKIVNQLYDHWVDNVYTAPLIQEQYNSYGRYINGLFNFSQKGITSTTDDYAYLQKDGH